jgi:bifunctional UDP-N-acetylglucosamine pyrophosphorylase / glucosamine-1-phosphate N-acetyltransferase
MIDHVIDAADIPSRYQTILVLSPVLNASDALVAHLQQSLGDQLGIVIQHEALGTGDALRCAVPLIGDADIAIVLFADHPLLTKARVAELGASLHAGTAVVSLLTCIAEDAAGYGRVERGAGGRVQRIVERKDDSEEHRRGPIEINSGMISIDVAWLRVAVERLTPSNSTGEFYLTQLVELAVADGKHVTSVQGDLSELAGINDRTDLARADALMQNVIQRAHERGGVTLIAPQTTVIEHGAEIGTDTVILPGCMIGTGTVIGSECEIGPHSVLTNARIGDRCRIQSSYISDSEVRTDSDVGPFSHIRGGAVIESDVHVGNFAEIKNSVLASGVRMGHFGYMGDASIGQRSNIGAGAVTCNYDGVAKHRTDLGADVFIGSDTMLVAPLTVGDRAVTGAGAVVTRDVPPDERVAGVPARPISKSSGGTKGK